MLQSCDLKFNLAGNAWKLQQHLIKIEGFTS